MTSLQRANLIAYRLVGVCVFVGGGSASMQAATSDPRGATTSSPAPSTTLREGRFLHSSLTNSQTLVINNLVTLNTL